MLVKVVNGRVEKYPYSISDLRLDNPGTSFPKVTPDATLAAYGVYSVSDTPRPNADYTKNVVEDEPRQVDGKWTQVWNVSDASPEEISARIAEKSKSVRSDRNYLLQQTDWMALQDADPMSPAWASYRQALRDITKQAGFPFDVTWPDRPSS